MKNVFASKIVWFNIVLTVADIAAFAQTILTPAWLPYLVLVQGIGTIILRIWFSSKELTFTNGK